MAQGCRVTRVCMAPAAAPAGLRGLLPPVSSGCAGAEDVGQLPRARSGAPAAGRKINHHPWAGGGREQSRLCWATALYPLCGRPWAWPPVPPPSPGEMLVFPQPRPPLAQALLAVQGRWAVALQTGPLLLAARPLCSAALGCSAQFCDSALACPGDEGLGGVVSAHGGTVLPWPLPQPLQTPVPPPTPRRLPPVHPAQASSGRVGGVGEQDPWGWHRGTGTVSGWELGSVCPSLGSGSTWGGPQGAWVNGQGCPLLSLQLTCPPPSVATGLEAVPVASGDPGRPSLGSRPCPVLSGPRGSLSWASQWVSCSPGCQEPHSGHSIS